MSIETYVIYLFVAYWCMTAPSQYLKQYWSTVKDRGSTVLWHSSGVLFSWILTISAQLVFENWTYNITDISPRGQWVDMCFLTWILIGWPEMRTRPSWDSVAISFVTDIHCCMKFLWIFQLQDRDFSALKHDNILAAVCYFCHLYPKHDASVYKYVNRRSDGIVTTVVHTWWGKTCNTINACFSVCVSINLNPFDDRYLSLPWWRH